MCVSECDASRLMYYLLDSFVVIVTHTHSFVRWLVGWLVSWLVGGGAYISIHHDRMIRRYVIRIGGGGGGDGGTDGLLVHMNTICSTGFILSICLHTEIFTGM